MFDYLQQFNNLSKDLRDRVSSSSALALISELENKYRVDLAMVVMKLMIKSLRPQDLAVYFVSESGLASETAAALARELKEKVLAPVAEYLGLSAEKRAWDLDKDIDAFIREAGLVLPSAVLVGRFKNILATYLRGVRSKIDTRNSLSKDAKIGGLNLSEEEINRVLKVCEAHHFSNLELKDKAAASPASSAAAPVTRLDKIMAASDKNGEYDLKQSLASGATSKLVPGSTPPPAPKLDYRHELGAPVAQLDLPIPVKATPAKVETVKAVPVQTAPVKTIPTNAETPKISPIKMMPVKSSFWSKFLPAKSAPKPTLKPTSPSAPKLSTVGLAAAKVAVSAASPAGASILAPLRTVASAAAPQSAAPAKPAVPSVAAARAAATAPVQPAAKPTASASRPAPTASARPQMHDIKPVPKVMGPIEELQFLDLVNFRRLGATPAEITAKILAKIKLLERDGYDKMVAGVKAWRQSPVSRLYLRLGQEAAAKGLPFREAIAARQAANQEYLKMEEVEAIVSLNGKLMF